MKTLHRRDHMTAGHVQFHAPNMSSAAEKEHRGLRRSCVCSRDNLPLISSALSEAEVEATPSVSPLTGTSDSIWCSNYEAHGQTLASHMLWAAVFRETGMGTGMDRWIYGQCAPCILRVASLDKRIIIMARSWTGANQISGRIED